MKHYKIRHLPTGLFFKPSRHPDHVNLSKTGKVYAKKPSLNSLYSVYYNLESRSCPVVPSEWEIVVFEVVEVGTIPCEKK